MVNHLYSHQFWRVQQSSGPTRGPINNIVNMLKKEHTMNQHQPMRYYVCKPTQHIHIVCIGFSLFQWPPTWRHVGDAPAVETRPGGETNGAWLRAHPHAIDDTKKNGENHDSIWIIKRSTNPFFRRFGVSLHPIIYTIPRWPTSIFAEKSHQAHEGLLGVWFETRFGFVCVFFWWLCSILSKRLCK